MKKPVAVLTFFFSATLVFGVLGAEAPVSLRVDLSKEKPGAVPAAFLPAVGDWVVGEEEGAKLVRVDGRAWKRGQPATGLADTARSLYGARHEEFLENVKAFAYFPIAAARDVEDFREGEISVRFRLLGGQLDQCAGILFDLAPNGDYLTVRYNLKDTNVVLWTFNKGVRKFVKKGPEDVTLSLNTWHTLRIAVKGTALEGWLDDKKYLDFTLVAPVSGRVGLWSKTDSVTDFADFTVTR